MKVNNTNDDDSDYSDPDSSDYDDENSIISFGYTQEYANQLSNLSFDISKPKSGNCLLSIVDILLS